jgi:inorganic pyrophosphatase
MAYLNNTIMDYASKYIGQIVDVTIDRPLNSKHPQHDLIYLLNYGYLEGTKAPDGEEVDAYVLGVDKPIKNFRGKCIAIIHRLDDEDDKLIVVPENTQFSDEEIMNLTKFQEKYFTSKLIR